MIAALVVGAVLGAFVLAILIGGDDGPPDGGDPVDEYIRMKKRRES
jgi:hypothetical protein